MIEFQTKYILGNRFIHLEFLLFGKFSKATEEKTMTKN